MWNSFRTCRQWRHSQRYWLSRFVEDLAGRTAAALKWEESSLCLRRTGTSRHSPLSCILGSCYKLFVVCVCVEEPPSGQSGSDLEEETGEGRGKVRSLSDTRVFLFFSENLVGH